MAGRYRYKRNGNCWEERSGLEKILICAAIIALIIVITLVVLLILELNQVSQTSSCNTSTCLGEAAPLIQRIDPAVNPCEDFYNFACGSLLKTARGDEKLGPFYVIQEKAKRQIQEMYSEPVRNNDHKTVSTAKKLYRACLNETAIEKDGLNTVRQVLRIMGGWPVVEGPNWDASAFQWLYASQKLRGLGYFYSSFLELTVEVDPQHENRFIFKVSVPNVQDFGENLQIRNKQRLLTDIAVLFGADEPRAVLEMAETYDFMLAMEKHSYLRYNDKPHLRVTVAEYQKVNKNINWLEYINNIIGPAVKIFRDDYVLFPPLPSLQEWFDFISKTPKRTQANYIMWKAIEETIPYLNDLQSSQVKSKSIRDTFGNQETRSEFCIRQIRQRFLPSPVDIMYVRKYLPPQKKREVEDIIKDLKSELLNMLDKGNWIDSREKEVVMDRLAQMAEVVGAPGNYFDDEILDDLDVDLIESNTSNFLTLLSQVNKNHQSWKYNQIYNTKYESRIAQWKLQTASVIGDYFREENVINIPATILQGVIFDENRPKYLNFGSMGTLMGHHFLQIFGEPARIFDKDDNMIDGWSNGFKNIFVKKTECFSKQMNDFNITDTHTTDLLIQQSLGLKISYGVFKNWAKNHKEEVKDEYSPTQLFWVSAASYFCQPSNPFSNTLRDQEEKALFSFLFSEPMLNNQDFGKDFNCPVGSKMNPIDKCEIF